MTESTSITSATAQDLAGKAILFEIGAKAGLLEIIEENKPFTVSSIAAQLNIKEDFLNYYFDALTRLELLTKSSVNSSNETTYQQTAIYSQEKNKIGYIAWGMMSCAPLIANTQAFINHFDTAVRTHHRCGEHVARTSKWMGETDFYPHAEKAIEQLNPRKMIDLGSGTCGLLIRLANKIPGLKGIGVDVSKDACDQAIIRIKEASLNERIEIQVAPIQELVTDNDIFVDVDVVHAGFVFHDLLPDEEAVLDKLLSHIRTSAPKATLVIVDAVPFSQNEKERAFSNAFSFLHKFFMGRRLLTEEEWQTKLVAAGFTQVKIERLGISGGRIFIANGQ